MQTLESQARYVIGDAVRSRLEAAAVCNCAATRGYCRFLNGFPASAAKYGDTARVECTEIPATAMLKRVAVSSPAKMLSRQSVTVLPLDLSEMTLIVLQTERVIINVCAVRIPEETCRNCCLIL